MHEAGATGDDDKQIIHKGVDMPMTTHYQHRSEAIARKAVQASLFFAVLLLCTQLAPGIAAAQGQAPIVYPSRGQTMDQQAADEQACRGWAQQQTGFSPYNAPQYDTSNAGQGNVIRGAAGGAALGAVGGAIAGDAGKGAAVGAGVGAAAGLLGRARQQSQQTQSNQQVQQNYSAALANFNRAFGACMVGRGYTVS